MLLRTCQTCCKSFRPIANQQYCGEPCISPSFQLLGKKRRLCDTCGKETGHGNRRYCSEDCKPRKAPKPKRPPKPAYTRLCEGCNEMWEPSHERVKTMLCLTCREKAAELHVYKSKKAWREAVRQRAGNHCEECDKTEQETGAYHHAHHLTPREEGGLNTLANGKLLCLDCHDGAHGTRKVGGTRFVPPSLSNEDIDRIAQRIAQRIADFLQNTALPSHNRSAIR